MALATSGGRLRVCGNGGSAADSQHIAAEYLGRFLREREPLAAIALTTNSSALTAIGNDYGFEQVFSRQVRAHARPDDVLLGLGCPFREAAEGRDKKKRMQVARFLWH